MNDSFQKIFIGLLLILIDIRIEALDLLPDFIGYMIIIVGLNELSEKNSEFTKAKPFALILTFLALPNVIGYWEINLENTTLEILPMVYQLIIGMTHLFLIYFIFSGIKSLAMEYNDPHIANTADHRWNVYAVISLVYYGLSSFLFNISFGQLQITLILIMFAAFFMEIVILVFLRRVKRESEFWQNPDC